MIGKTEVLKDSVLPTFEEVQLTLADSIKSLLLALNYYWRSKLT